MDIQQNRILPRMPDSTQQTQRAEHNLQRFHGTPTPSGNQAKGLANLLQLLLPLLIKLLQHIGNGKPQPQPQPVYGAPIEPPTVQPVYGAPIDKPIFQPVYGAPVPSEPIAQPVYGAPVIVPDDSKKQ